jgi:hypothetical protein
VRGADNLISFMDEVWEPQTRLYWDCFTFLPLQVKSCSIIIRLKVLFNLFWKHAAYFIALHKLRRNQLGPLTQRYTTFCPYLIMRYLIPVQKSSLNGYKIIRCTFVLKYKSETFGSISYAITCLWVAQSTSPPTLDFCVVVFCSVLKVTPLVFRTICT